MENIIATINNEFCYIIIERVLNICDRAYVS